jgi:hypothetical protein
VLRINEKRALLGTFTDISFFPPYFKFKLREIYLSLYQGQPLAQGAYIIDSGGKISNTHILDMLVRDRSMLRYRYKITRLFF